MFSLPDNLSEFASRCLQLAEAAPTQEIKTRLLAVAAACRADEDRARTMEELIAASTKTTAAAVSSLCRGQPRLVGSGSCPSSVQKLEKRQIHLPA
jgi:hypothetical protein